MPRSSTSRRTIDRFLDVQRGLALLPRCRGDAVAGADRARRAPARVPELHRRRRRPVCSPTVVSPGATSRCRSMPARRSHARHDHDAGGDAAAARGQGRLAGARVGRPRPARRRPLPEAGEPHPELRGRGSGGPSSSRRRREWAAAATGEVEPRLAAVAGPPARARRRQGRLHGGAPSRRGRTRSSSSTPRDLADDPRTASSIKGAARSARTVDVDELEPVDLVVTGCVAVDRSGARLGKGGGFSDLELAVAAEAGLVDAHTIVVTTVHALQVLDEGVVPTTDHDIHVDLVVTPERVVRCPRPRGWALPFAALGRPHRRQDRRHPPPRKAAADAGCRHAPWHAAC